MCAAGQAREVEVAVDAAAPKLNVCYRTSAHPQSCRTVVDPVTVGNAPNVGR
jgi:hypothetical protein